MTRNFLIDLGVEDVFVGKVPSRRHSLVSSTKRFWVSPQISLVGTNGYRYSQSVCKNTLCSTES